MKSITTTSKFTVSTTWQKISTLNFYGKIYLTNQSSATQVEWTFIQNNLHNPTTPTLDSTDTMFYLDPKNTHSEDINSLFSVWVRTASSTANILYKEVSN